MNTMQYLFFIATISSSIFLFSSNLYEKIESLNLHAFKQETPAQKTFATYTEQLQTTLESQQHLTDYQKRLLTFSIFKSHEKNHPIEQQEVIDETTWRDLNLFVGSATHPESYLGSKINYATTDLGAVRLLGMLANPQTDTKKLYELQRALKELIDNEDLFVELDTALAQLKDQENFLLSWFDEHDAFKNNAIFFKWIKTPGWPSLADKLNTNSPLLEVRERLYETNMLYFLALQAAGTILFPVAGLMLLAKPDKAAALKTWAQQKLKLYPQMNFFYIYGFALYLAGLVFKNNGLTAANDVIAGQHNWLGFWSSYDQLSANNILLQGLQRKLMSLARCVEIMNLVKTATENTPVLHDRISKITTHQSEGFTDLVEALQSNTFAGNESSIFSYAGRILSTAKLAYDHHHDCVDMLAAIGEIDALMSLARLYKASNYHQNGWSFAQHEVPEIDYEEQQQPPTWYNTTALNMNTCFLRSDIEPWVQLDEFWNPLLDHEEAVANTVSLGDAYARTMIITGINKGGKSTNMKGLILSTLCAQTIGIVPASLYIATPFTKILTYCNPHDDIAKGVSHFEAGEQRALHIYNTVAQLREHEHALCMLDEAFDGTHHAVSVAATTTLVRNLGYNPHVICLMTTHLPEVTKLEETNQNYFVNYHVESILNTDGTITFTYQLKPGISYQNELALELLRQQNYPKEFIENAYMEMKL